MGTEGTVLGVVIAVVGVVGSVLVARVSAPRVRPDLPPPTEDEQREAELKVSPEIWRRFSVLEAKVDHLTALVEEKKEEVTTLQRLLRVAMRIVRRANRKLVAAQQEPETVPVELFPYSID